MTYPDAISWLYSTQGTGIKLGLENISRLLTLLGVELQRPPGSRPFVFHVAGTNGKGSVCAMLDAICRAQGLRTGLFTSPHLVSFRERIRLNGVKISEADVAAGLTRIRETIAGWEIAPTFFEITTALALAWFQEQRAEVIILETGLGGRLDSTNAVTADLSILTPISFDHRQYLGNTLGEIAAEKAGILKPGVPVVSASQPPEAAQVIETIAVRVGAPLKWISEPAEFEVGLAGCHQRYNAALAVAAARAARLAIDERAIRQGLRDVVWPGRFQRLTGRTGTPLVLDGAHNEAAAVQLVQTWHEIFGEERPIILLSVLQDKDVAAVCRHLAPLAVELVVVPVQNARACSGPALADFVRPFAPATPCIEAGSVAAALEIAEARAQKMGCPVLITGSLFLVGETLAVLENATHETSLQ
ncbi:MAG: folylpolyglutamate synthase/dihydrofolate synthase family protein [Verrucomicrobiota bacterium]